MSYQFHLREEFQKFCLKIKALGIRLLRLDSSNLEIFVNKRDSKLQSSAINGVRMTYTVENNIKRVEKKSPSHIAKILFNLYKAWKATY